MENLNKIFQGKKNKRGKGCKFQEKNEGCGRGTHDENIDLKENSKSSNSNKFDNCSSSSNRYGRVGKRSSTSIIYFKYKGEGLRAFNCLAVWYIFISSHLERRIMIVETRCSGENEAF